MLDHHCCSFLAACIALEQQYRWVFPRSAPRFHGVVERSAFAACAVPDILDDMRAKPRFYVPMGLMYNVRMACPAILHAFLFAEST